MGHTYKQLVGWVAILFADIREMAKDGGEVQSTTYQIYHLSSGHEEGLYSAQFHCCKGLCLRSKGKKSYRLALKMSAWLFCQKRWEVAATKTLFLQPEFCMWLLLLKRWDLYNLFFFILCRRMVLKNCLGVLALLHKTEVWQEDEEISYLFSPSYSGVCAVLAAHKSMSH